MDQKVRAFIRGVLHLTHDFSNATFYASAVDGGLGVPCMRWSIPAMARSRLNDNTPRTIQLSTPDGKLIKDGKDLKRIMRKRLLKMVDGMGLVAAPDVPVSNTWITGGSSFLTGKDFISCVHVGYNCLVTKARSKRGRKTDKMCSKCCGVPETLNHILQNCHVTAYSRIKRHDFLKHYICRSLNQRGFTTHAEKSFSTPSGDFKSLI